MSFPLNLAISPATMRLGAGQSGEVQVTITNVSDVVEHYEVSVVGLPSVEYWRCEPPDVTKLRPGESATVRAFVTLPPRGGLGGGTYPLAVLVRSPYQPSVSRAADLSLTVEAVSGVTLAAQPTMATGKTRAFYGVLARNEGNVAIPLTVSALDDRGRARFVVEPSMLYLNPGEAQQVRVEVSAPGKFSGQDQRSSITIRADNGPQKVAETQVSFVQPPRVPGAVMRTIGIVLAVAIVAAAILTGALINRAGKPQAGQSSGGATPSMTSQTQGQNPPKVSGITVTPEQVMAGGEVTVAASAEGVESYAWTITDPDGQKLASSTEASFSAVLPTPGTYTVQLLASAPGGATTVSRTVEVGEKPPAIVQQAKTFPLLQPGSVENVTVDCPNGMRPVSGGVRLPVENNSAVSLVESSPSEDGWKVQVSSGSTVEGLEAVVVCAAAPLGYSLRTEQVTVTQGDVTEKSVACDEGQVVWGGGAVFATGSPTGARVVASRPATGDNGEFSQWSVQAVGAQGDDADLTVIAVCADAPTDYTVIAEDLVASATDSDRDASARCPNGTDVLGGGNGPKDGTGDELSSDDIVRLSGPVVDGGNPAWRVAMRLDVNADVDRAVYAICGRIETG